MIANFRVIAVRAIGFDLKGIEMRPFRVRREPAQSELVAFLIVIGMTRANFFLDRKKSIKILERLKYRLNILSGFSAFMATAWTRAYLSFPGFLAPAITSKHWQPLRFVIKSCHVPSAFGGAMPLAWKFPAARWMWTSRSH